MQANEIGLRQLVQ